MGLVQETQRSKRLGGREWRGWGGGDPIGVLDSGDAYLPRTATCICMGRRPETREVYKRNETEVDGWKREKEEMGGKRYLSSRNAYLITGGMHMHGSFC